MRNLKNNTNEYKNKNRLTNRKQTLFLERCGHSLAITEILHLSFHCPSETLQKKNLKKIDPD